METIQEVLRLLEQIESIIKNYNPSAEDKQVLEKVLAKNMELNAEIYAKYIKV
ncbi:hypothetical protein [Saccharolobus solfataricus]|uniref:Uncharacterized protein n=1 Tax=Saccharolobus solfataricus (strain 98/2) TaxID=555311 RepID=D0KSF8_SACS9|nr:hypothetical protein [Saccharolobus solfataricus]